MATRTRKFGTGGREGHDASPFYERKLREVVQHRSREAVVSPVRNKLFAKSSETMEELPDDCVALMVTSPPYHVGKDYDSEVTFDEYLKVLGDVFRETYRVLEPGGRAVVNVANLGRRPYISLAGLVAEIMDGIGFLPRGEVIWAKGKGASGSCAWGSWQSANNPTFRDLHEYCLCFSKERYDRAFKGESTITGD